jgi:ribonuclease T2
MNTSLRFAETVSFRRFLAISVLTAAIAGIGACKPGKGSERRQHASAGQFDSYVLTLSWAPAFCADSQSHRGYRECDTRRHLGFVVHGLWPERGDGKPLEYCKRVPPVSHEIVEDMLSIMPDRELIQHEWRAHGSCSGMSPREYFGAIRTAFSRVRVPTEFQQGRPTRSQPAAIEEIFGRASQAPDPASVRVACRQEELTEVRICLSRSLEPIPCSNEVRECHASSVFIRAIP